MRVNNSSFIRASPSLTSPCVPYTVETYLCLPTISRFTCMARMNFLSLLYVTRQHFVQYSIFHNVFYSRKKFECLIYLQIPLGEGRRPLKRANEDLVHVIWVTVVHEMAKKSSERPAQAHLEPWSSLKIFGYTAAGLNANNYAYCVPSLPWSRLRISLYYAQSSSTQNWNSGERKGGRTLCGEECYLQRDGYGSEFHSAWSLWCVFLPCLYNEHFMYKLQSFH